MKYNIKKIVNCSFVDAVSKIKTVLAEEGFGILTEIDVKTILKNKLNVEWGDYAILGVCNPPLAYQALQAQKDIGLFMPCNVIVYEDEGKIFVSAMMPTVSLEMLSNSIVREIARQAEEKLNKVFESL